jgi:pimeloyl-ACP methyl ester carboxylesterase
LSVPGFKEAGSGEPVVFLHGIGGNRHAFDAQLAEPGRVRSLVLAQTMARFGKPGSDWQQQFLDARLKPLEDGRAPADFARELITGMFGDPSRAEAIERAVATMSPLPADVYRQVLTCLVGFDQRGTLPEIDAPTLCLAAELDQTAPPRTMEKMATEIPAGRYDCLQDAGHLAYVEGPAAFTRAVNEFLGQL